MAKCDTGTRGILAAQEAEGVDRARLGPGRPGSLDPLGRVGGGPGVATDNGVVIGERGADFLRSS